MPTVSSSYSRSDTDKFLSLMGGYNKQTQGKGIYGSALSRFTQRQRQMREDFAGAESPLQTARALFERGGGYGAGQRSVIEERGQQARASVLTGLVGSGMASGSNIAGATAAISKGMTQQLLQVEDVRTEQLSGILQALSQLRAGAAGVMGTVQEPEYGSYVGGLANTLRKSGSSSYPTGGGGGGYTGPRGAAPATPAAPSGGGGPDVSPYRVIGPSMTGGAPEYWGPGGQTTASKLAVSTR